MKFFFDYGTIEHVSESIRIVGAGIPAVLQKTYRILGRSGSILKIKEDKKVWDTKSASKK